MKVGGFTDAAARRRYEAAYAAAQRLLPAPVEQRDVATGAGDVRAYRFGPVGSGPVGAVPVVLLPGRATPAAMWAPNVPALAARRSTWAVDLLGEAGASVQRRPIRDDADQARWVAETLDDLVGDRPVHLVAHSIGARHALEVAVRFPARAASLSLLEPAHTLARLRPAVVLASLGALLPAGRGPFMRWLAGGEEIDPDDPIAAVVAAGLDEYRTALPVPSFPTAAALRSLAMPVLALLGGRSVVGDAGRAARRTRALVGHAEVEVWPRATHALTSECAGAVDARLAAFLDAADRRSVRP